MTVLITDSGSRPVVLDLFCGAGGASRGYHDAGFDVIGVDHEPQSDYPYLFIQGDALKLFSSLVWMYQPIAVVGSPPCQAGCALTKGTNQGRVYPQLIPQTRELFEASGLPYVIENVAGAPIRKDLMLCGEMFGLGVIRHRYFEIGGGLTIGQPLHPDHRGRVAGMRHGQWFEGPYFAVYGDGGGKGSVPQWQQAMGIDWTDNRKSIAEAIPPLYAQFIGEALMKHIGQREANYV